MFSIVPFGRCCPLQAFEGENRPPFTLCLVPWADSLNHSSAAGEESCLAYDPDTQRASLRCHVSYQAGEEVFDSYGPWLGARQLLLDYGFVDAAQQTAIAEVPVCRCSISPLLAHSQCLVSWPILDAAMLTADYR